MIFIKGFISLILSFYVYQVLSIPIDNALIFKPRELPGGGEFKLVCGKETAADIFFIIDSSGSIGATNYDKLKGFLVKLVHDFTAKTHVAAIQFSNDPYLEFSFNTYNETKAKIADHFKNMQWRTGLTFLAEAIEYSVRKELIESRGDRPGVGNVIVVITDGVADDNPNEASKRLREKGTVLVVGVTKNIDFDQLLEVAGGIEENVFTVDDFDALDEALKEKILSKTSCQRVSTGPKFGEPSLDIECGQDIVIAGAETKNPFEGAVYVKGRHDQPECNQLGEGTKFAQITIPTDACGTVRRRSLNPPGIFIENTVVFRFHQQFLTKIDQAFKVQCFYMEAEKTVPTELEVGALTTVEVTNQFPMPTCTYTIHQDSPTGPPVKFAIVGQPVFHKWTCDNAESGDIFQMKVKNCFVDDGEGNQANLLDESGCSIDKHLLPNLEYGESVMMASTEAHVFKFADKPALYFQCQIELCVNYEDGCKDTPPDCTGEGGNAVETEETRRRNKRQSMWTDLPSLSVDVISDHMTVIDQSDVDSDWFTNITYSIKQFQSEQERENEEEPVCLTNMEMYFFISLTCGSFLLASTTAFIQMILRRSI